MGVIGNLSSAKDSSNEGKTFVGLEKFSPSGDINPIKCPTRDKEKSSKSQVEHKNRFKTDPKLGSDVLDLYPSKCSFFKDCEEEEASHFSSERLIEEIEVDSVLSLNLDEDSHLRDLDEDQSNHCQQEEIVLGGILGRSSAKLPSSIRCGVNALKDTLETTKALQLSSSISST